MSWDTFPGEYLNGVFGYGGGAVSPSRFITPNNSAGFNNRLVLEAAVAGLDERPDVVYNSGEIGRAHDGADEGDGLVLDGAVGGK